MPLKIKGKEEHSLNLIGYDKDCCSFVLEKAEKDIKIKIPYVLKFNDELKPEDYEIHLFFHQSLPENYIFQIYEKTIGERIGWIFPIQALQSINHDYADNPHFLKRAYVSFYKLISPEGDGPYKIPKLLVDQDYSLDDFYSPNTVIVLLSKLDVKKIKNFNLVNYAPFLFKYGYFKFNTLEEDFLEGIPPNFDELADGEKIRTRINIEPISEDLRREPLIKYLFTQRLTKKKDSFVHFVLLYQVIELLIARIFNVQFKKVLSETQIEKVDLFEFREQLSKSTSEKKRISYLLNDFTKKLQFTTELREKCDEFLELSQEEKDKPDSARSLYKVRSFLIHNFRNITINQVSILKEINYYFENLIISVLINYKEDK